MNVVRLLPSSSSFLSESDETMLMWKSGYGCDTV